MNPRPDAAGRSNPWPKPALPRRVPGATAPPSELCRRPSTGAEVPADAPARRRIHGRWAAGYLRVDLDADSEFDLARLRLSALVHGYEVAQVVKIPAGGLATHVLTMLLFLHQYRADAVIALNSAHLCDAEAAMMRGACTVIVGDTVLPQRKPGQGSADG